MPMNQGRLPRAAKGCRMATIPNVAPPKALLALAIFKAGSSLARPTQIGLGEISLAAGNDFLAAPKAAIK